MDVYIARQPIFDENYNVIAYELLYRDSELNYFSGNVSNNVATSILLINSHLNFGIDNLISDKKAYINFNKHLINTGIAELLDKERVVIEILEDVIPDKRMLKNINKLLDKGYTFAIDDYTSDYKYPEIANLCSIVKIDFIENTREQIEKIVYEFKKSNKILVAEKVESKEEFEWAKKLKFDYYQGYYFSKPKLEKRKTISTNALVYIKLMNELNEIEPDYKKLTQIITADLALTYKLLKIVNLLININNEVTSIKHAIAILGINELKIWISLAMVGNLSEKETNEVIKYAMIRSNLLKIIASNSKLKKFSDQLSLIGILSVIDVVLEVEMCEVIKSISLSEEIKNTLLGKETKYSDPLSICLLYERGKFEEINELANNIGYDSKFLAGHYFLSLKWAESIV